MSTYKPTKIERETIILFDEAEEDAEIYTYNTKLIDKCKKRPSVAKLKKKDDTGAYTFIVPKKLLTIIIREPPSEKYIEFQRQNAKRKIEQGLLQPFEKKRK